MQQSCIHIETTSGFALVQSGEDQEVLIAPQETTHGASHASNLEKVIMTRLLSSSLPLQLAFAVALSLAGGAALFLCKAHAAEAHPTSSLRCYIGAKHEASTGWVCVPESRNADTQ